MRLQRELQVRALDIAPAIEIHEAEVFVGQREELVEALAGTTHRAAVGVVVVGPKRRLPVVCFVLTAEPDRGVHRRVIGAGRVLAELRAGFGFPEPRVVRPSQRPPSVL